MRADRRTWPALPRAIGRANAPRSSPKPRPKATPRPRKSERFKSMCGIVGVIGRLNASDCLLEGLRRLEYRGYDSAGIATLVGNKIERRRAPGKIANLA